MIWHMEVISSFAADHGFRESERTVGWMWRSYDRRFSEDLIHRFSLASETPTTWSLRAGVVALPLHSALDDRIHSVSRTRGDFSIESCAQHGRAGVKSSLRMSTRMSNADVIRISMQSSLREYLDGLTSSRV